MLSHHPVEARSVYGHIRKVAGVGVRRLSPGAQFLVPSEVGGGGIGPTQGHRIFVPKKIAASVRGLFGAAV